MAQPLRVDSDSHPSQSDTTTVYSGHSLKELNTEWNQWENERQEVAAAEKHSDENTQNAQVIDPTLASVNDTSDITAYNSALHSLTPLTKGRHPLLSLKKLKATNLMLKPKTGT